VSAGRGFAAGVDAALLGRGDALALAFEDQGALELGEGAHDRQQQGGHRRVLAGEGEALLDELDPHALAGQGPYESAQVVEVAGEAVHRMHDHGVAGADVGRAWWQVAVEAGAGDAGLGDDLGDRGVWAMPLFCLWRPVRRWLR